jgi:hypothetical protein
MFAIVVGGAVLLTAWTKYLKGRVAAGHEPWNSFGHNRDLHSVHRDRAMGIAPLTGIPDRAG